MKFVILGNIVSKKENPLMFFNILRS